MNRGISSIRAEYLIDDKDTLDHDPERYPHVLSFLPGVKELLPSFGVPSLVLVRKTPKAALRESPSLRNTFKPSTQESWTHVYTDSSAENAIQNGGAGVYIQYPGGRENIYSLTTGLYCTNYKAEAEALKTAAAHIEVSTHASHSAVLLTDALSMLHACLSNRDTNHNHLSAALASLCRSHAVTLQWIPSHCNVPDHEAAHSLAKEDTTKEQVDRSTSYPEVKTILKAKQHSKWRLEYPWYKKADSYNLLTRWEQVDRPQLPQLYSSHCICHIEQCPCGTGNQTTEHLLQSCPLYEWLIKGIWPDHTTLACKFYGSQADLRCTAIEETGVSIWRTRRRRRKKWCWQ